MDLLELALRRIAEGAVSCFPCCAGQGVTRDAVTRLVRKGDGFEMRTPMCRECAYREVANGNADGMEPVTQPRHVLIARAALEGKPLP